MAAALCAAALLASDAGAAPSVQSLGRALVRQVNASYRNGAVRGVGYAWSGAVWEQWVSKTNFFRWGFGTSARPKGARTAVLLGIEAIGARGDITRYLEAYATKGIPHLAVAADSHGTAFLAPFPGGAGACWRKVPAGAGTQRVGRPFQDSFPTNVRYVSVKRVGGVDVLHARYKIGRARDDEVDTIDGATFHLLSAVIRTRYAGRTMTLTQRFTTYSSPVTVSAPGPRCKG